VLELRSPKPDEGEALTALCLRSKAIHGYDAAFMAACRAELTVHPQRSGHRFAVAEAAGVAVGLAEIACEGRVAELQKLFVEPVWIGKGVGRALLDWARQEAISMGADRLMIDSDPGATDFYLALGAVREGLSPSGSIPGRFLPRLRFDLGPGAA
jgi:GNAT superfamily N-acetyltransferase